MKEKVLISVYNKEWVVEFAKSIVDLWYEIITTEWTGKKLIKNGISFIPANTVTNNPDWLTDCIQTISYNIQAWILFDRSNINHNKEIKKQKILPINIVVCNFPPINEVIKNINDFNITKIDVWWPLMVRAAATNFKDVIVIVDTLDYKKVAKALLEKKVTIELRKQLAIKAYKYTKNYDNSIIRYLNNCTL